MLRVLKFSATWCGPCKTLVPVYDKVMKDYGDVIFEKIDVDEMPDLATKYKIQAVPTIVFLQDGVEVERLVGVVKESEIKRLVVAYK